MKINPTLIKRESLEYNRIFYKLYKIPKHQMKLCEAQICPLELAINIAERPNEENAHAILSHKKEKKISPISPIYPFKTWLKRAYGACYL